MSFITSILSILFFISLLAGLFLLLKVKLKLAIVITLVWLISVYLLYRNFAIGTQAALGFAPESTLGIVIVFSLIILTIAIPIFLIGFIPYYFYFR